MDRSHHPTPSGSRPISNYGSTTTTNTPAPTLRTKTLNSKIEPKVWFANERTWLNWCRTGILLASFGIALVNCSPSTGARLLGVIYSLIAFATIIYGYRVYQKRIRMINERFPGHFDEPLAPILIAGALFMAILMNFVFRMIDGERHRRTGEVPKAPWIAAPARFNSPSINESLESFIDM